MIINVEHFEDGIGDIEYQGKGATTAVEKQIPRPPILSLSLRRGPSLRISFLVLHGYAEVVASRSVGRYSRLARWILYVGIVDNR